MLRHNNRGAGLVTVVTVLAVCGILLAGVLGFAYQHYKNVMLSSSNDAVIAEVELCAELLLKHLNSEKTEMDAADSIFNVFYASETESVDKSGIVVVEDGICTIYLSGGDTLRLESTTEMSLQKYTIAYCSDTETVVSRTYYFKQNESDSYELTSPPEPSDQTEVTP